jgi:hypothetical protein
MGQNHVGEGSPKKGDRHIQEGVCHTDVTARNHPAFKEIYRVLEKLF